MVGGRNPVKLGKAVFLLDSVFTLQSLPFSPSQRELKEETGLIAAKWSELLKIHTSNSVTDEYGFIYLAEELIQGEMDWDETEELQIKSVPLKEAVALVMDGHITDSMSIAGILKAARKLGL